jgi:hypothetical protein
MLVVPELPRSQNRLKQNWVNLPKCAIIQGPPF